MKLGLEEDESSGIVQSQKTPDHELCMPEAKESHDGLTEGGEEQRAYEGSRHGTRKGDMVVAGEFLWDVLGWCTIDKDIMCGLNVEGLLHLGIRCNNEVEEDDSHHEQIKADVWRKVSVLTVSYYCLMVT